KGRFGAALRGCGGGVIPARHASEGRGQKRNSHKKHEETQKAERKAVKRARGPGGRKDETSESVPKGRVPGWSPGFSRFGSEDRLKPGLQPHPRNGLSGPPFNCFSSFLCLVV